MSDIQPELGQDEIVVRTNAGSRPVNIYSEEGYKLLTELWLKAAWQYKFSYELTWSGIPIIQLPEDILMMHELIYKVRPDVIVETGTAHGGTAVFYASMLELIGRGHVISIDVEIRRHNRLAIQAHPMNKRISLVEGSSVDGAVVARVRELTRSPQVVLVALDSNHSYAHVLQELESYAPMVTPGSYMVVFDSVMETLTGCPGGSPSWATDSPATAIRDFLARHEEFEVDPYYNRLGVTYCPGGFLRRKME
jgi:cephalosporin hydroxylase